MGRGRGSAEEGRRGRIGSPMRIGRGGEESMILGRGGEGEETRGEGTRRGIDRGRRTEIRGAEMGTEARRGVARLREGGIDRVPFN